jgi:hypothetical protein
VNNPAILTPRKVFDKYKRSIEIVYRGQQDTSILVISAIIEIGRICQEAREYKKRLNLKNKDDLWEDFEKSLPFSKASIARYIAIFQHPTIRLKKYQRNLPPSVYSLYELSKIQDKQLEHLIESGKVNSDIGRTELNLLLQGKSKSKRLSQSANEIEILSLRLPLDSWEDQFEEVKQELIEFLEKKGVSYVYGNEIQKREQLEQTQSKNIEKYVFMQLKKHFTKQIKSYIEQEGKERNLFKKGKTYTFKQKAELIGFNFDEVDCSSAINDDEIEQRYLACGIGNEKDWNKLVNQFMGEAFEKYPYPAHLLESNNSKSSNKSDKFDSSLLPIKRPKKYGESKFKGIKV